MSSQTPEERRRQNVRLALGRLIAELVTDVDPEAFEVRPPWPGAGEAWGVSKEPLPLPALVAARRIALEARGAEREAIEHARGRGETWTEIGRALGDGFVKAAKDADIELGLATWNYAAHRIMPGEEIPYRYYGTKDGVRWRCWTCAQYVFEGHPDNGPDAEEGHGPGCARLAARKRRGWR